MKCSFIPCNIMLQEMAPFWSGIKQTINQTKMEENNKNMYNDTCDTIIGSVLYYYVFNCVFW